LSEFSQGKFEQTVEGILYFFVKPDASNKAVGTSVPSAQQADPRDAESGNGRGSRGSSQSAANAKQRGQSGAKSLPATSSGSAQATSNNGATETPPGPNDQVQPSPPPEAPTSGSGEPLTWYDDGSIPPPPTLGRVSEAGLEQAPDGPQDISRDP
jgi:hypothetical protein